ncbi:MAG TPA: hypothetical protein VIF62_20450 [Labilithrix sp.]|jgi:hypothetical protein
MARNQTSPTARLETSPLPTLVRASIAPICIDVKIIERDDATTTVRKIDPPRRGLLEIVAAAALMVLVGSTAAGFEAARAHASAPDVARTPRTASVSAPREATITRIATAPEKTTFEDAPPAPRRMKTVASSPKPRARYPWLDR